MQKRTKTLALTAALSVLLACPAFAQAPAVSTDLAASMPAQVQSELAKAKGWQTLAFQDTATDYWVLLTDTPQTQQQIDSGARTFELLQISKQDWSNTKVQTWTMTGGLQEAVPMMQCSEQGVWVLFYASGETRAYLVDNQQAVHSYTLKSRQAALGENGVAGFDAGKNAFVLWDGKTVKTMAVNTPAAQIRQVTCYGGALYYLDNAGNFYKANEYTETWISNLQDMYENIAYKHTGPDDSYKLDSIDALNLCYSNGLLWLSGADTSLPGGSALLQYDGKKFVQYDIPAGHILHVTPQRDGSTTFVTAAYNPAMPGGMNQPKDQALQVSTVKNGSVTASDSVNGTTSSFFNSGITAPYKDAAGVQWEYGGPDAIVQQTKPDGTTYGYGLQFAKPDIHILLDGTEYYFDREPVIRNSRTMVPLRGIASLLNMRVDWKDETVILQNDTTSISLKPGKKTATVNSTEVALDSPAINLDGRVMVPLRFVAENFNAGVDWTDATRTVTICSDGATDADTPAIPEKIAAMMSADDRIVGSYTWGVLKQTANGVLACVEAEDAGDFRDKVRDVMYWDTERQVEAVVGYFSDADAAQKYQQELQSQIGPDSDLDLFAEFDAFTISLTFTRSQPYAAIEARPLFADN